MKYGKCPIKTKSTTSSTEELTLLDPLVTVKLLCLNIPFGVLKALLLSFSTISKVLYLCTYEIQHTQKLKHLIEIQKLIQWVAMEAK